MIIVDTNVISELMRQAPAPQVVEWFDARGKSGLHLCAPVLAELRAGAAMLPEGARKVRFEQLIDAYVGELFHGRILPFDEAAADAYAMLKSHLVKAGRAASTIDVMIASIASAAGARLATRNTRDFAGLGVKLVNPFEIDA